MKGVTKYADAVGNSSNVAANVKAFTDYLFLLAEFEVQGTRYYANQYEQNYQKQYAYYSSGNSRVMYRHNATGSTAWWWLRSAYYGNCNYFCYVNTDGSATRAVQGMRLRSRPALLSNPPQSIPIHIPPMKMGGFPDRTDKVTDTETKKQKLRRRFAPPTRFLEKCPIKCYHLTV